MKKFLVAFILFIAAGSLYNNTVEAQNINISINVGRQPAWGPIGYDYVGYYYFPDIDIYYNVNLGMFYYPDRGRWVSVRYLPARYRHYDLYGLYKVVLNVNDPWRYHNMHYRDYARYRGYSKQVVIRDSRDVRYRNSRNNRVVWYSDNKRTDHRNDYRPDNNRRDKNYSDKNRYTNNERNNSRTDNNKNYSRPDNNKNNERPVRSNGNNSNVRDNSNRDNSKTRGTNVTRPSSSKSGEYRLASNTERNDSRRK
ncbi:MAG: hypothetical protein ACK5KT_11090 [Dysgonomonas sp.]